MGEGLHGATFKTTNGRASILVVSHCTVFTIKTRFDLMRTDNSGNLRYCYITKPTVIDAPLKNCSFVSRTFRRISEQIFFSRLGL